MYFFRLNPFYIFIYKIYLHLLYLNYIYIILFIDFNYTYMAEEYIDHTYDKIEENKYSSDWTRCVLFEYEVSVRIEKKQTRQELVESFYL